MMPRLAGSILKTYIIQVLMLLILMFLCCLFVLGSEVIEAKIKQLSEETATLSKNHSVLHETWDESL